MCRCCLLALGLLSACHDGSRDRSKLEPAPADIKVTDGSGAIVAELKATRPCRAVVGAQELIVGGPPLVATQGAAQWTGASEPNGTTLSRDGERIARVYPVGDAASGAVFDLHGIAQARVTVTGDVATVENKSSVPVRKLTRAKGAISSDAPALTITGTDDLILAALLSAPELLPEVRMLAACERVLVTKELK